MKRSTTVPRIRHFVWYGIGLYLIAVGSLSIWGAPETRAASFSREPTSPIGGTLFLCGGGKLPETLYDEFSKLAGGEQGRLVVITTASVMADTVQEHLLLDRWTARRFRSITRLHTRSRDVAADPAFTRALREATAVWITGGEQRRLLNSYAGTPVADELHRLLARGGVIGGTSAGMALIGDVAIVEEYITYPRLDAGFGFVNGVIFDQHFSERRRQGRLAKAVAQNPGFVGIGVDERTALLVQGRELKVLGEGNAHVVLGPSSTRSTTTIRLREHMRDDLVALSRAALARAGEVGPPLRAATRTAVAQTKTTPPRVDKGSLLIVGGGRMTDAIQKKFLELAGGLEANIVVVPTAGDKPEEADAETSWLTKAGAKSVSVVHARSRDEAESESLLEILRKADGIWFGGGRQWRFVDAYEGTACYEAFHDVLKRGGVIGGSSAGATIQGEYLVRGSPMGNTIMMAEGYERGFNFLPGTAIDQHFTQRQRAPDMVQLKKSFPQLLGLGIDEATAVVVRGQEMEVVGDNKVSVYPPRPLPSLENDSSDTDLPDLSEPHVLESGETYDLVRFVRRPTSVAASQ
ncbi:MAG: cyanophycinase [Pirellula sp.]|nr:cyanophycinase [Pirellula sp.]